MNSIKKKLKVLQDGYKECGSASLLSIIRYYHGDISINRLVDLTKTDKFGTNFYNIKEASQTLGLSAKGFKVDSIDIINKINKPFICQFNNNSYNHFVVVYKVGKSKILIMDPAYGFTNIETSKFQELWTNYIMIFEPFKPLPVYKTNKYLNDIIIKLLLSNYKIIINILLYSLLFTIMTCFYTFYFEIVIDTSLDISMSNLTSITTIFLFILIIKNVTNYIRNYLLIYISQRLDCSLILNTFKKILLLPYDYYKNKTTGEIISRINDLGYIKNMLSKLIITVFLDLIICLVGGIILFNISHQLFYYLIIIILIYIVILLIFKPLITKLTNINQENTAQVNSFLVENIGGFETVKGLNIESIIEHKMDKLYINTLKTQYKYDILNNIEYFLKEIVGSIGMLYITYIGFKEVMLGNMSLGNLITFNSLLIYFIEPIRNIIDLSKEYYYSSNSLKRANNLFEIELEKLDKNNNIEITGNIEFKDVNYSFNSNFQVLENINIKINNQEKVLIVGSSGSGKSTLLKLINQYHSINRNKIFINNIDICDIPLGTIRENIAYISQNEIVYTATIKDNVILDRKVNYLDFLEVCKLTYLDEIFADTFSGYDTLIEENGANISGGQRQRIILARTLLKKAKIIMIDEGLNEIDINLERKILKNIFKYYKDSTILIVSHRNNNADLFDKIIKFNNNKINIISKENTYE